MKKQPHPQLLQRMTAGCTAFKEGVMQRVKEKAMLVTMAFFTVFLSGLTLKAQDIGPGIPVEPIDPGTGCTAACMGNVLNISTGFNQSTSTYNTPLALETNWTMVAVPTNATITLPAPCWDIPPYPVWNSFPNARWVSPYQNSSYIVNNWPPTAFGAYEFQKCFCVCKGGPITIQFDMLVDDAAEILLDGVPIASAMSGYQFWLANKLVVNYTTTVTTGSHCLSVKLYNAGAVAMGFAVDGTITGANLLATTCCNPNGSICGIKINDANCDGVVNPTVDAGLAGWTIQLFNSSNVLIATAVTDAQGNYCFTNLPPGVYTVSEVNQPGWTQTYPASGSYTINIHAGDVGSAIFGNCHNIIEPPPCDFHLGFDGNITNCGINFTPYISGLPAGYQVVSTLWNFGDGSTSNQTNGIHYYNAAGPYTVCLTVTIFNGEECCTKTYCREIYIETPCSEGCHFDAEIGVEFNPGNCDYTFSANILYAGSPVTSWFWDFGDATTGTGTPITHQFPGPGTYMVCLYLFSNAPSDDGTIGCCFAKICREVTVDCKGKATVLAPGSSSAIDLKENSIVLDQNSPNPFAESTVIRYEIPSSFSKAQLVFTNVDSKVIKTLDITEKGKGQVTVYGSDLKTGMYMYSLIVDDKIIDSKRMIKN